MDFFGAQDAARRRTWQLAALFAAAVVCLVVLTNLLVALVYGWTSNQLRAGAFDPAAVIATMPASYWVWISGAVLGGVALASLYKYLQMRGGGRAVAEALGGRRVPQGTSDSGQRRLLNVVEEMAIASGVPVPPTYLIEEPSINAFAAGFSPDDAVIGVNRGTIEHLNRDELQGVVAHEFSHLLNGDSRLNLRLIAVLHGILFMTVVGRGLLYGAGRRSHRRRGGGGGAPVLALGVGLLVIGYTGTFFGNLIKAAVSRQREYLADAASVQFTRNPGGLAGALKKIGGLDAGSTMSTAQAGEMSHIFFGQAGRTLLNGLMATHPPLEKRIKAVEPTWNGRFPALNVEASAAPSATPPGASGFAGAGESMAQASPHQVVDAVGRLDRTGLARAADLIAGLPGGLSDAAHDPFSGRALIYALVLDTDPVARSAQLQRVADQGEPGMGEELARLQEPVAGLDQQRKLTLIEMAMPALKELSAPQYRRFTGNLVALIKADRRIDLMEWVLHRLLVKELKPHFEGRERVPARYNSLARVADAAGVLLSALARESGGSEDTQRHAFAAGRAAVDVDVAPDLADDPDFARLNRALTTLRALKPLQKPRIIKACAATVLADGGASPRQAVLLQGVAATLDCPLPPTFHQVGESLE